MGISIKYERKECNNMTRKSIYGIKDKTIGVYKITCKINGHFYIGASVSVGARISSHMGRDSKKYTDHPFYEDVRKYGREAFEFELLEECSKDVLLEREQFYYDLLKPYYNKVRPAENNFQHKEIFEKAKKNSNTEELVQIRKEKFNSPEYKEMFRKLHKGIMKPIIMTDLEGNKIAEFESLQECSRWLDSNTDFKGKNKTSKIKAVADGERKTAFGYKFHYIN